MGYDVERFVGYVNEGLLCCVCRDVLEDPLQSPCEHVFCSTCIHAWLVNHHNCPEDRLPLSIAALRPLYRYLCRLTGNTTIVMANIVVFRPPHILSATSIWCIAFFFSFQFIATFIVMGHLSFLAIISSSSPFSLLKSIRQNIQLTSEKNLNT